MIEYRNQNRKSLDNLKNVIGVFSGKGGVGKTTLSMFLASELNKRGFKVGLLDADLVGPNMHSAFDTPHVIKQVEGRIFPNAHDGIKIVSTGFLVDETLTFSGNMQREILRSFIHDTVWGELDYLIVDLPPGSGDIQLELIQTFENMKVVLVSTPHKFSVENLKLTYNMLTSANIRVLGLVINMSFFECPCGLKHRIWGEISENTLPCSILAELPVLSDQSLFTKYADNLISNVLGV